MASCPNLVMASITRTPNSLIRLMASCPNLVMASSARSPNSLIRLMASCPNLVMALSARSPNCSIRLVASRGIRGSVVTVLSATVATERSLAITFPLPLRLSGANQGTGLYSLPTEILARLVAAAISSNPAPVSASQPGVSRSVAVSLRISITWR